LKAQTAAHSSWTTVANRMYDEQRRHLSWKIWLRVE
jgi:hypothetical protein